MISLVFASLTLALSLSQAKPLPKPDFSGAWVLDRTRSQSTESVTLEITQGTAEVSIETNSAGKASKRTYPFEMSKHSASETISAGHTHASWDGTKLVTELIADIKGQTVSYRQMRFLNDAGTEMVVETITIVQHGYSMKDGKNYAVARDVYVRPK